MNVARNAVQVFLEYLKAEKVDTVFGVAGGLAYPLFAAIEADPDLRFVMTRHEEGAAFMADGYARVGRRLGVCVGTSGPGSTNLMTGVACAFADGVPLLIITGQAATHALGRGAAQETPREDIDIVSMFRPITKYSAMVTNSQSLPQHVRRALRQALTGRPGPVHLNVPVDLWQQSLNEDWFEPSSYRPETHTFDRTAVQKAVDSLLEATNPVFLVGSGVAVAGAERVLEELAHLLDVRVATTPRAKGVFPEDNPRSLGVLGTAGHREARDTILGDSVDVLFTIGTSLSETTTFNWSARLLPRSTLIQLDIDADRIARNYPVGLSLIGDAHAILVEILYHVHRKIREGHRSASQWSRSAPVDHSERRYDRPDDRIPIANTRIHPAVWRAIIDPLIPYNAVVFSDIGGHMLFNIHHLTTRRDQRFIINLGFGSMGHGTVAPIGAALSGNKSPIIAIVGDGCFQMNGLELLTAVEAGVQVIWIIENNQMHGISWHGSMELSGGKPLASTRYSTPVDNAGIARAMGVRVEVVERTDQIDPVFRRVLKHEGPSLIDMRVDPDISPPLDQRNRSLAGFILR